MKKQWNRIALSGLLATGLTLCSGAAFAQQDSTAPAPDTSAQQQPATGAGGGMGHTGRMGQMTPDEQLARMTRRYNLSADQQTQIKPIIADQQQKMQALRGDSSMSREDRMTKMKAMREDASTKISAILNDTQKQQFTQDQQRMQEHMQERMHSGDGGAPQQ